MQTVQKNEPYLHFLRFNGVFYAILLSKISATTFFYKKYTLYKNRANWLKFNLLKVLKHHNNSSKRHFFSKKHSAKR